MGLLRLRLKRRICQHSATAEKNTGRRAGAAVTVMVSDFTGSNLRRRFCVGLIPGISRQYHRRSDVSAILFTRVFRPAFDSGYEKSFHLDLSYGGSRSCQADFLVICSGLFGTPGSPNNQQDLELQRKMK